MTLPKTGLAILYKKKTKKIGLATQGTFGLLGVN